MTTLIAALVAAIPNVLLAIFSKLVTQSFLQSVIERVLAAGLRKAAAMTTNPLDNELAEEVIQQLQKK